MMVGGKLILKYIYLHFFIKVVNIQKLYNIFYYNVDGSKLLWSGHVLDRATLYLKKRKSKKQLITKFGYL
jgi:hypothetical protein